MPRTTGTGIIQRGFPRGRAARRPGTEIGAAGYSLAVDAQTALLLHCDGVDLATSFPDSSPATKTVTAAGGAKVKTDQFKFGTASARFTVAGDGLTVPAHADWTLGTGDFTVDLWARWAAYSGANTYQLVRCGGGAGDRAWYVALSTGQVNVQLSVDGTNWAEAWNFPFTPAIDTWYHIAVARAGTSLRAFVNGAQVGSTKASSSNVRAAAAGLMIGMDVGGVLPMTGWLDEIRISKGVARWTNNFAPPAAQYA